MNSARNLKQLRRWGLDFDKYNVSLYDWYDSQSKYNIYLSIAENNFWDIKH